MRRVKFWVGWTVAILLAGLVSAQAPAPAVNQILDKYITALGGRAAQEKLTSRVAKGTIEITAQGATLPIEISTKAPNRRVLVIDAGADGIIQQGFDGAVGWASNPAGVREMAGGDLANARRGAIFYGPLELRKTFPKMTLLADQKVGEKTTQVIQAEPGDGTKVWMYFDTASGLLIRAKTERDTEQEGKATFDVYLEDYRAVDGVKVPFTIRQDSAALSYVIRLTEVKHNVPLEDSKFAKPTAQ